MAVARQILLVLYAGCAEVLQGIQKIVALYIMETMLNLIFKLKNTTDEDDEHSQP